MAQLALPPRKYNFLWCLKALMMVCWSTISGLRLDVLFFSMSGRPVTKVQIERAVPVLGVKKFLKK